MTAWCHLPTIFNRRYALRSAGLISLCAAFITTLLFANVASAVASTNRTVSFQGRLLTSSGAVVADGHYNFQFKIYQDGLGTTAGNTGGTLKWTESYVNNNSDAGIEVKNGFFSVSLGSLNPFGTSVDWDQETLWLSMSVAGSAAGCTTFGSAPCVDDGEMLPMKGITATPYAINSGQLGGKTADNFTQLGQGVQTDSSTDTSSIFINKTSSGNLIQLQSGANDVFTVSNTGDLSFGNNGDKIISIDGATPDTAGKSLSVIAGAGGSGLGSTGGDTIIQGGAAGGTDGNGGNIQIDAGASTGSGSDGTISIGTNNASTITIGSTSSAGSQEINVGANNTSGGSSNVIIGAGGSADSGTTTVQSKDTLTIKTDGTTRATFTNSDTVHFGNGESSVAPNDFNIQGTNSSADGVNGGSLMITGGDVTVGNANGGDIVISGGNGSGTGVNGSVIINTPTFATATSDPNCYTSSAVVAASCTIADSSVNNSAAVIVGFSTTGQTATLPDPAVTTAGRVLYVMAADTTEDFTLSINGGATSLALSAHTTTVLIWNGTDWTTQNGSTSSVLKSADNNTRVQVGDGVASGDPTLATLDKGAAAPVASGDAILGSMYYDTTLGKVQCYEADGWGSCGASPDSFITITPEYANAVMNGTDLGTITSDLCSDTLNINDGSSSQPTICGTNETFNFYNWTSAEASDQTRSIFVTYQLPGTFKEFVAGSTSLLGRTDSANSAVSYQIYRDSSAGLSSCGSTISVSTGSQTTWQKAVASGVDPASCGFEGGDSILVRINLTAKSNANAYVSNLGFTFSNN